MVVSWYRLHRPIDISRLAIVHEAMQKKLGGKDADQRHVVTNTGGSAGLELFDERGDRAWREDGIALELCGRQEFFHVSRASGEKTFRFGSAIGLFVTRPDRFGNQALCRA